MLLFSQSFNSQKHFFDNSMTILFNQFMYIDSNFTNKSYGKKSVYFSNISLSYLMLTRQTDRKMEPLFNLYILNSIKI